MTRARTLSGIGTFLRSFGSVVATAGAVERGLTPEARHLRALGIDPRHFDKIGRL